MSVLNVFARELAEGGGYLTFYFTWKMSTVSFCCRDCSTPGTTLFRKEIIPSLDIIFVVCQIFSFANDEVNMANCQATSFKVTFSYMEMW